MRRPASALGLVTVLVVAACSDDDTAEDDAAPTVEGDTTAVAGTSAPVAATAPDTTPATSAASSAASPTTPATVGETTVAATTVAETVAPTDGPYERGAEWEVDSPAEHGIDRGGLRRARRYAFADGRNTQSVVVVHDGAIVAEWYDTANGAGEDSWAASWSMAKSFTSALIGIAIDEGLIPSVDERMTTYYPAWTGTAREDIVLGDVLQMASGLDWVESYDPANIEESDIIQMVLFRPNQLGYAARRPALRPPGTTFNYSSGDTMLLSGVIEQVTGMTVEQYAEEKLFEPLGIDQVEWWRDARDHTLTYCCLDTTSRDFARFGLLYLNDGAWGDQQVVPEAWVEESLETSPSFEGYGFQWWLGPPDGDDLPSDVFSARGHDGQYIYVIPSLDLVVVRNGTYAKYDGEPVADPNLFGKYPSDGLVPGEGTSPPEIGWDDGDFLGPIVEAVEVAD